MEAPASRRPTSRGWVVPASAVLFAVLFVVGVVSAGGASDTENKTNAEILQTFSDEKAGAVASGYLLVLAGLLFLPVAWGALRRVGSGLTELSENVARSAAILFVGLMMVSGIVFASLAGAVVFGGLDDPPVAFIKYIPQMGFGLLLIAAALPAALFLVIVAIAGQASRTIPRWFARLTYVTAAAMLVAVAFIPMVMLPVWALGASVALRAR
jgi:hypothetical protein